MCALGLFEDHHHARVPYDSIVEANPRVDIWMLLRCGALVEGTTTELAVGAVGDTGEGPRPTSDPNICRVVQESPNVRINETCVPIVWDSPMPSVSRPWFLCACGRRARYLYLRDTIACARCHGLQNASLHLRRQTPGVGRVERLRRKLGDCELRPFAPLPARIRTGRGGRSRAYHERLVSRILDEEEALLGHLQGVTRDLDRRIEVRKARGQW